MPPHRKHAPKGRSWPPHWRPSEECAPGELQVDQSACDSPAGVWCRAASLSRGLIPTRDTRTRSRKITPRNSRDPGAAAGPTTSKLALLLGSNAGSYISATGLTVTANSSQYGPALGGVRARGRSERAPQPSDLAEHRRSGPCDEALDGSRDPIPDLRSVRKVVPEHPIPRRDPEDEDVHGPGSCCHLLLLPGHPVVFDLAPHQSDGRSVGDRCQPGGRGGVLPQGAEQSRQRIHACKA